MRPGEPVTAYHAGDIADLQAEIFALTRELNAGLGGEPKAEELTDMVEELSTGIVSAAGVRVEFSERLTRHGNAYDMLLETMGVSVPNVDGHVVEIPGERVSSSIGRVGGQLGRVSVSTFDPSVILKVRTGHPKEKPIEIMGRDEAGQFRPVALPSEGRWYNFPLLQSRFTIL